MSEIEKEILAAAKVKAKKNEERPAFLKRLAKAISGVPDEVWEALSPEAQAWYNGAAEKIKSGHEVEDFDDAPPEEEAAADEPEEEAAEPAPAKNGKAQTKDKPKPVVSGRKVSACHSIKKLVVDNPKITVAELSDELREKGLKVSDVTIATLRSDMRDTLRVLNEADPSKYQFSL